MSTLIKEMWQEKRKNEKDLSNEKLTKLYNKLYRIKIYYYDKLDYSDIFADHGEVLDNPDYRTWDSAINEVKNVVDENIHLLESGDLKIWESVIEGESAEHFYEEGYYPKYEAFLKFLRETSETYIKLYRAYHR